MIDNMNPVQYSWWVEALHQDFEWLIFHKRCRVKYPTPCKRLFHVKMLWEDCRWLTGYWIKRFGMWVGGDKITYNIPKESK